MGSVLIKIAVMPDGPEADIKKIKDEITRRVSPKQINEKPIAFGIKMLEVLVVRPDAGGGTDDMEKAIAGIDGVATVEVEDVTLM